jgi:hypothetical protein
MFDLSVVLTTPMVTVASSSGCTGLEAVNPLCYAATAIGSVGGSVASAGVDAVLGGLSQWVATGAEWLLSQIGSVLVSTTTIDLGASWFRTHYEVMTALAGVVVLPLLLVSILQAVYQQNAGQLIRTFFVRLPLALLLGVVAIQIVILCLSATDALCAEVAGGSGSNVKDLLADITKGLVIAVGDPSTAAFVLLLVGLLVATAAFVLWLELLVRASAVYVAVLFLPLALTALVWPSVSHWCRRLVETLTALILSKFVIVATLSLAAGALSSGTAGDASGASSFASVLAGGALLVLATFVPFSILRLIPMVEAGAIGHLEGLRQRGTAALTRVPRSAAQYAMQEGMAAHGAAKLAAQTGPPGIGDGDELVSGGSQRAGTAEDCNWSNGGLIPNADGKMIGLPVDEEALAARWSGPPKPRGPKPILAMPARAEQAEPVDTSLPPGLELIGKPGPHDRRYALGSDEYGPVIHGLPPLYPRDGDQAPSAPESS